MSALSGKVAVVTGATSGIGEALATKLVEAGALVAGVGRNKVKLGEMADAHQERFIGLRCDLANQTERAVLVAELARRFDRVDVLVNNAAEVVYESPSMLDPAKWRHLLELNLVAAIELTHALAPRMPSGSHLVNTSSATARQLPNARFAPYALTKSALEELTNALRLELDPRGVKVTLVVPGLVDTPIYETVPDFARTREKLREQVPCWLSASDVADAVMWTLTLPPHVVVAELVVLPQGQAR